jgi:two-component sensor histidine kinase
MFHPDDQERAWEQWRHSLATGDPYEIEYRLRHHSGEYRWVLGRALPVRDPEGAVIRWIGTCTDIDESKRSAERNELLSRELSHRIKNIFAVISGLVSLTGARTGELRPVMKELIGRIAALGRAHEFARPHSPQSAPEVGESTLHGLLTVLLRPYSVDGNSRIGIRGADAMVDDKGATPLALVIHELATNAAKYGALSTSDGHVMVDISKNGGQLELVWMEQGGPEITGPPTRHGFGTDLAELSVSRQLGGEMLKEWLPEGLKVTMRVDARRLHRGTQSV